MLVDTHVHVAVNTYEPVEMLLAQMELNGIAKALLVLPKGSAENDYLVSSMRYAPGRLAMACGVNASDPNALEQLEHWQREGAQAVRLANTDRSPDADPLALWRKAAELRMVVNVYGTSEIYASPDFAQLVAQLPELNFVFEHLAGMGLFVTGKRPRPADDTYRQALTLARYPNTYVKIHGMGEVCYPPFPFQDIPPYVRMACEAFGPQRTMWGSDWPPVVTREGYRHALRFTMEHLGGFYSANDMDWIFGKTALSLLNFEPYA